MKLGIVTAALLGAGTLAAGQASAQEACAGTSANTPTENYALACGREASADGFGSTAVGSVSTAGATYATALGHLAKANGAASTAIGAVSEAGEAGTAIGTGSWAQGTNSVALGAGSIASDADTVSFGNANIKRRVTNLADGIAATDAATVGQLDTRLAAAAIAARAYADEGDAQTLQAANAYTDAQIAAVTGGSKAMQEYANSGTAAAMAAATIPQAFAPGGTSIGAGLGHWRGESALSIGASHLLASGRISVRGSASLANRGGAGGAVGVAFNF